MKSMNNVEQLRKRCAPSVIDTIEWSMYDAPLLRHAEVISFVPHISSWLQILRWITLAPVPHYILVF